MVQPELIYLMLDLEQSMSNRKIPPKILGGIYFDANRSVTLKRCITRQSKMNYTYREGASSNLCDE